MLNWPSEEESPLENPTPFEKKMNPIHRKTIPQKKGARLGVAIRIAESRLLTILLGDSNRPITI